MTEFAVAAAAENNNNNKVKINDIIHGVVNTCQNNFNSEFTEFACKTFCISTSMHCACMLQWTYENLYSPQMVELRNNK